VVNKDDDGSSICVLLFLQDEALDVVAGVVVGRWIALVVAVAAAAAAAAAV